VIPTLAPARARSHTAPAVTRFVDLVALSITLLMLAALIVPGNGDLPGRPALALLVVTFVPGWTTLRLFRIPMTALSVLSAFALSVSLAMLTSLIMVGWLGWHWRALAIIWMLGCAAGLGATIVRPLEALDDDSRDTSRLDDSWAIRRPRWRDDWSSAVDADVGDWRLWAATLAGLVISAAAIAVADPGDIDGYGLIAAVPLWFFAGVALLLVALFAQLRAGGRSGHVGACVNLGFLIVLLHGLTGFIEPNPRFPVAWLHAGFADHIAYEGELLPRLDARFSWAGFFSGAAFVERVADTDDLVWLLRFAPVAVNIAAAIAVFALARAVNTSTGRSIVAATIFVFGNWIGQDYFAPQAVGFVLVTTLAATVLTYFSDAPAADGRVARWFGTAHADGVRITGRPLTLVYLACLFVAAAVIASHQLSPPMLFTMLVGLSLVGRIRTKLLGPIVGLGFVLWVSHAAESYWVGHLPDLLNQVGDVGSVVNSNVSKRAAPGSPARELVVRSRMVLVFAVWGATAVALVGQRRRRSLDPALAALFFAPFVVLGMQSYGGEVLLRVALFTLPAASILIARMELPLQFADRAGMPRLVVPVVALSLVAPVFVLARYGNESYEQVIPDDRAVVEDMYRLVPDDSSIYVVNRSTLMDLDRLTTVRFRDLSSNPVTAQQMLAAAARDGSVYVLITDGQAGYRQEVQGALPGWLDEFASELIAGGSVRVVSQHGRSMLLEQIGGT
jgi:hypothetical protein